VALDQVLFLSVFRLFLCKCFFLKSSLYIYSIIIQGMDHVFTRSRSSVQTLFHPTHPPQKKRFVAVIVIHLYCLLSIARGSFNTCDVSGVGFTPVFLSLIWLLTLATLFLGYAVAQLVEALHYNPEGRGFDSLWNHWNF
jgi:hypothetical protein